jgi:hypothetical protein
MKQTIIGIVALCMALWSFPSQASVGDYINVGEGLYQVIDTYTGGMMADGEMQVVMGGMGPGAFTILIITLAP